jgi:nucleotidyltransferase/DNA polymerase involved in DNA repair
MQTNLQVTTKEELRHAWAFAAHPKRPGRRSLRHSVITACSRQAKALGVRAGMHYEDAKLVLPELKVFVYGRR